MIKVSVVVPVYNSEAYLNKCLDSLVQQTLRGLEIVVVNDGSTDNSSEIIRNYSDRYPDRFKVITKANGGQASARNIGIMESAGKYIGFLDSDDYADSTMYEKLYTAAFESESDVVECGYNFIRYQLGEKIDLKPYCITRQYKDQKDMFIDPLVSPWNKLYKADILKSSGVLFVEGCIYEDTAFYIKLIPFINEQKYVDEPLIYHIFWESSTMNANRNKKVADIFVVLKDILSFYETHGYLETYKEELEYFCIKILLNSSLGRVFQIRDKELRNRLMKETMLMIETYFSSYRGNKYLKNNKKGIIMKSMNSFTMPVYGWVYRRIKRNGYFIG